eukprot:SM000009S23612  [mRNA]  locus=s9:1037540:1038456:- [translate_table: standard]
MRDTHQAARLSHKEHVCRRPFNVGLLCVAINTCIFLYLAVWVRHLRNSAEDFNVVAPGAIPTATILGLSSYILFCYSLWPIWGILTMPLLFTLFMAFVVVSPYLPPYVRKPENRQD